MNAAATMMSPLRSTSTDLKTSTRFLQHMSYTQRTQTLEQNRVVNAAEPPHNVSCT
jgi:hypothetical protein